MASIVFLHLKWNEMNLTLRELNVINNDQLNPS